MYITDIIEYIIQVGFYKQYTYHISVYVLLQQYLLSNKKKVMVGNYYYLRTPKLRDSQAGRGGCFPSFRVD